MHLNESVVLISGGASGLGEATARYLVELGAKGVAILDLNAERGNAIAGELGSSCLYIKTDVADSTAVEHAVSEAAERFGGVHAVVAAAAIPGPSKLLTRSGGIDMSGFDKVMRVNVNGTVNLFRAAAAAMARNTPNSDGERGALIGVASGAAFEGQIGQVAYSASKGAIVGMTMPLARELASAGIRVVTVAPGAFETPIYDAIPDTVKQRMASILQFPRRFGRPSEFACFVEELLRNPMHNARTYRFDAGVILPATF